MKKRGSPSYPYEILQLEDGKEAKRLQRGTWPSHVPLPEMGDKINDISLAGEYIVSAKLFTKRGDEVLMVTLYVT